MKYPQEIENRKDFPSLEGIKRRVRECKEGMNARRV